MAALRKKYQGRADIAPSKDAPVMAEPPSRTNMPPVDSSPPPEDLSVTAQVEPVEQAAQASIKQRLTELENAEAISQQPQAPQFANEAQDRQLSPLEQILATVPEGARGWLRAHPEYLGDPEKNAQIRHAHLVAARETGDEEFGPQYYERLEHHLGLRPQRQPQQQPRPASRPAVRQQTSVSAPPTRDSISMSTGRPTGSVSLSGEEREFARMVGLSDAEYAENKRRMLATQQQ
jgi:hypothetical protein